MNEQLKAAVEDLALRLAEWDTHGEGKFSAQDFAVVARRVVVAAVQKGPSEREEIERTATACRRAAEVCYGRPTEVERTLGNMTRAEVARAYPVVDPPDVGPAESAALLAHCQFFPSATLDHMVGFRHGYRAAQQAADDRLPWGKPLEPPAPDLGFIDPGVESEPLGRPRPYPDHLKITLTTKVVEINGVPARLWEGTTEGGSKVLAFVTRLAVPNGEDASELERELVETPPVAPDLGRDFDARIVL
jgi:hypothetical protein